MKENLIFGPVLIPNKEVLRQANINIPEEHYIFFDEQTIKDLRKDFHNRNNENNVTINHNGVYVNGVYLTKSFIINKNNRKILPKEFSNLPNGTWMAEYLVENKSIWKLIEEKKIKGFSIESILSYDYSQ